MNQYTQSKTTGLLAIVAVFAIALVAFVAFVPTAEAYTFAANLKQGSSGADVLTLQKVLNMNAATQVSTSGAGSPGQETTYFGAKTRTAVIKFQNLYASEILAPVGLSSGTGFVGASTRAKLNAISGGVTGGVSTVPGCTSTVGYSPTTGQKCDSGVTTIPVAGGALQVSATSQPANALAVGSANRVPFTRVTLSAGASAVIVNSVTVERVGPAVDAVFTGVVLLDEFGNQIGISKTLNSNHQVAVGEPFTISAGTSRTVTIAGNMATAGTLTDKAGQVVGLNVVGVNTNGTVSGSLPVSGALHTINATLTIGTATLNESSFDPDSASNKEIGTTGTRFAGIRVQAGSQEQIRLRSIRWNQTGSAGAGDLANLMTYVDGVAYPTSIDSTSKYYTTNFGSGIVIDKGVSKDVYIQGDIVGGNASGRTVQFDIYKATDVYMTGETYGYGISGTASGISSATTGSEFLTGTPFFSGSVITVTAGSVTTLAKSAAAPAQNIAVNVSNQPLGAYEIDLKGEPISVQQHVFHITSSVAASGVLLTNVSLYGPNGNIVAGPVDAVNEGATNQKVTFTDTVTYPISKGAYSLKGKVPSGTANGVTFIASTTPSTDWSNVTGQTTGNTVSLSTLSTAVAMNTMTVKGAALAISTALSPAAQSIVAGTTGVNFANVVLDATQSGEDVRFSSLAVSLSGTGGATMLSSCQLFDGGSALNTDVVNPTAQGNNTFNFANSLTVAKGASKTLAVKCNVSGQATSSSTFAWGVAANANPAVTGVNSGADVTETITAATGQTMTIGTPALAVSKDPSSPGYMVVAANTSGATLGVAKFRPSTDSVILQRVGLKLTNTASSSAADLIQVSLWQGSTQIGTALFAGASTNATSTLTNTITLPKDVDTLITIKGDLADIGTSQAGTEGALIAVDVDTNSTNTQGVGVGSGSTVNATGSTGFDGVRMFNSYPTLAQDTLPGSGVADGRLLRFKVTASSAGDVALAEVTLKFSTTSANVDNVNIFGFTDSAYSQAVSGVSSGGQLQAANETINGAVGAQYEITLQATGGAATTLSVPAGATRYFEVRGTVTGTASTYSVTTTLEGDAAYPVLATLMAAAATIQGDTNDDFVWSPLATTTSLTTNDWTNGFGLAGLPSSGIIQTRSN